MRNGVVDEVDERLALLGVGLQRDFGGRAWRVSCLRTFRALWKAAARHKPRWSHLGRCLFYCAARVGEAVPEFPPELLCPRSFYFDLRASFHWLRHHDLGPETALLEAVACCAQRQRVAWIGAKLLEELRAPGAPRASRRRRLRDSSSLTFSLTKEVETRLVPCFPPRLPSRASACSRAAAAATPHTSARARPRLSGHGGA